MTSQPGRGLSTRWREIQGLRRLAEQSSQPEEPRQRSATIARLNERHAGFGDALQAAGRDAVLVGPPAQPQARHARAVASSASARRRKLAMRAPPQARHPRAVARRCAMPDDIPIRVNRAPVLTLWACVVAERLGCPPDSALSLASAVAGTAAHAKARRLGLAADHPEAAPAPREAAGPRRSFALLGKEVPVTEGPGNLLLAAGGDGQPAPAEPVRRYLARAFGTRLAEARAAMEALAAGFPPDELNRLGFRLYERFRPEVPEGVQGWGAKGELRLQRIRQAAT